MRAPTRKALTLVVLAGIFTSVASALPLDPIWAFAPVDSSSWRGDTLSLAMRADHASGSSLYLENGGSAAAGPFTLQLARDLRSESGGSISTSALTFDPAVVPELSAGGAASVGLDIHLSPQTPPEIYRGTIQALLPDMSVHSECVLELRVRNDENLRVAPNPVYGDRHRQVDFRIASRPGMNVDIDLFTLSMEKVRSISGDGPWSDNGVQTLSWDMTNEGGHTVASGMYIAFARFEVGGERFTETHRVMVVY